jgi:hypothetical protein
MRINKKRGFRIKELLGEWGNIFHVIDKVGKRIDGFLYANLISITSINVHEKSYLEDGNLYKSIMYYANKLAVWNGKIDTQIEIIGKTRKRLEVAIPLGASQKQYKQIEDAIRAALELGVEIAFTIVE